ncbi:hypothetical protein B0H13DRAFT_2673435 [Mycena leptocephala]|nr:hypothetical protein B0H13DRAFT_2673435 [Mycena leptocephala]
MLRIASVPTVTKPRADKHHAILIDLAIGLGIPLLRIPLRHRHNIFEDIGCLGDTYETPSLSSSSTCPPSSSAPSLPSTMHQILLPLLLPIPAPPFHLRTRQPQPQPLRAPHGARVHRPAPHCPLAAFVLYSNVAIIGLSPWPWVSWADTHSNFSRVVQVPGIYWRADPYSAASLETLRPSPSLWDTRRRARDGFDWMCLPLFCYISSFPLLTLPSLSATSKYHLSSHGSSHGASATLPVFIRKETTQKRDSFDSFSALYGGISPLRYDAEKAETLEDGDAHALTLGDVSGMLPDYKESDCSSSAPSSSSSAPSASSVHSEEEEGEAEEIEVSYLHRASVHITLCPPEPAHVRRPSADVPMPVVVRDVANIV